MDGQQSGHTVRLVSRFFIFRLFRLAITAPVPLGHPRYRFAPVHCFLRSSVTGKAPCKLPVLSDPRLGTRRPVLAVLRFWERAAWEIAGMPGSIFSPKTNLHSYTDAFESVCLTWKSPLPPWYCTKHAVGSKVTYIFENVEQWQTCVKRIYVLWCGFSVVSSVASNIFPLSVDITPSHRRTTPGVERQSIADRWVFYSQLEPVRTRWNNPSQSLLRCHFFRRTTSNSSNNINWLQSAESATKNILHAHTQSEMAKYHWTLCL